MKYNININQKALAKSYLNNYLAVERNIIKIRENSAHIKADRDQLAQALKETQSKVDSIKVRRDAKTGRMESAKRK